MPTYYNSVRSERLNASIVIIHWCDNTIITKLQFSFPSNSDINYLRTDFKAFKGWSLKLWTNLSFLVPLMNCVCSFLSMDVCCSFPSTEYSLNMSLFLRNNFVLSLLVCAFTKKRCFSSVVLCVVFYYVFIMSLRIN